MGLKNIITLSVVFLLTIGTALAAPQLRLAQTAVGPVVVAVGGSTAPPAVAFRNAGDGTLNLKTASSASWLLASVSGAQINISLQAGSLARGLYTGFVTVSDPNAVDAPQTISVTMQVGSAILDNANFYVAPGGTASASFTTGSKLTSVITTQGNVPFLSLALDGAGSFAFTYPYRIAATAPAGLANGPYTGSVAISGSSFAPDNKIVPVTLNVTSQPIAQPNPAIILARAAQNSPKAVQGVNIGNSGLGTLNISSVTAAMTSGSGWLSAVQSSGAQVVLITEDPAGLTPGSYFGTVTVASNAANGNVSIPVQFDVVAPGPPFSYSNGALNNGQSDIGDPLADGAIVSLYGEQFTTSAPQQNSGLPLPTSLNGVSVFVNDQIVPLYYVSYGQINFQMPYNATVGNAVMRVENNGQRGNSISLQIADATPRILKLGIQNYGIVVNQDGSFPIPVTAGIFSHPAKPGDILVIYATGLGQTTPPVTSGAAAPTSPLAGAPSVTHVQFGASNLFVQPATSNVQFAGLTPGFVGLYQINVAVPPDTPLGDQVTITLAGSGPASRSAAIAVQAP